MRRGFEVNSIFMDIEKLNATQNKIVQQLGIAIAHLGGKSDLLCIVGSLGDTLPESQILEMLEEWNAVQESHADA